MHGYRVNSKQLLDCNSHAFLGLQDSLLFLAKEPPDHSSSLAMNAFLNFPSFTIAKVPISYQTQNSKYFNFTTMELLFLAQLSFFPLSSIILGLLCLHD